MPNAKELLFGHIVAHKGSQLQLQPHKEDAPQQLGKFNTSGAAGIRLGYDGGGCHGIAQAETDEAAQLAASCLVKAECALLRLANLAHPNVLQAKLVAFLPGRLGKSRSTITMTMGWS